MDKRETLDDAMAGIEAGMVVAVGGFGGAGFPDVLVSALYRRRLRGLVLISNNVARFEPLIAAGSVARVVCSFPFGGASPTLREELDRHDVAIELVPQGTLAERLRCAGAGLGGVLTRVGLGTAFSEGKPTIDVGGREYLLEEPLPVDYALVEAAAADRWGNLVMRGTARNFNVVMAMAGRTTVAAARRVVELGEVPADACDVPGIFVDFVVDCAGGAIAIGGGDHALEP